MVSGYALRSITNRTTLANGTALTAGQYGPTINATYPLGAYIEDYAWNAANGDLDEYNGRWCVTPEYPSGTYAYFITINGTGTPEYPFIIGPSYYGVPERSNFGQNKITISETVTTYFTTVNTTASNHGKPSSHQISILTTIILPFICTFALKIGTWIN